MIQQYTYYKLVGFFWGIMMLFSACNNGITGSGESNVIDEPEKEIELHVSIPSSSSVNKVKSISESAESAVNSIYVLSFKVGTDGSETYQYSSLAKKVGSNSYNITVRVQDNAQRFVLIANVQDEVLELTSDLAAWYGQDKETMLSNLNVALEYGEDRWNAISDESFKSLPMWGESEKQTVSGTTVAINKTISLMRMVAKIEVQLDESVIGLTDKFKLKSVYLYNSNTQGAIVPEESVVSVLDDYIKVTAPTIPEETTNIEGPIKYTDFTSPGKVDVAMKGAIYTFETKAPANADNMKATCLVIGGVFKGDTKESYYRIDFMDMDNKGNRFYLDILRNNKYLVNVVNVLGRGYDTPDIAYRSKAENLVTDILYWNESDFGNIVFDGQYSLAVSTDSLFLWNSECKENQSGYNEISILTDYATSAEGAKSGWYVERIVDAETGSISNLKWLTLSVKEGVANEKSVIGVYTDANTSGRDRGAIVTIAAGRLRFKLKIVQTRKAMLELKVYSVPSRSDLTYLYFRAYPGEKPAPQTFKVKWTPVDAPISIAFNQLTQNNLTGEGFPVSGLQTNETGELTFTIQPDAFVLQEDSFAEKLANCLFTITDGETVLSKSIIFRQSCYNMLFTADGNGYMVAGQMEKVNVKSNYNWKISRVSDPYDVLQDEESLLVGLTGGNEIIYGENVRFRMAESTIDLSKNNKTASIFIKNIDDNTEREVILRAEEHLYVGYFSGDIVEDEDGGRHYERRIFVQNKDEDDAIQWQNNKEYTYVMRYIKGKDNTLDLMNYTRNNSTTLFPAASACFSKNVNNHTIQTVNDDNYVWYLPASLQLYAIWVVGNSFPDAFQMNEGFYWSSVEYPAGTGYGSGADRLGPDAWVCGYVNDDEGHTFYGPGKLNLSRLRCVRELK